MKKNTFLSESFTNRFFTLSGLLVEGKEDKLMKLGFNEQVAKSLIIIDEKYAMFIGDICTREFAQNNNINKDNIKEILPMINQGDLMSYIFRNEHPITIILEWLKSPLRTDTINLREIRTLTQAWDIANHWHNNLVATGIIEDESGEIIKQYPQDGLYWIDLQTNSSKDEGNAMGHCGQDGRATTLFSLRDKNKSPHVTIAYNANTQTVTQVKGKNNKKPVDKYMAYVFDFLGEMANKDLVKDFTWSYTPNGSDLNNDEIKKILGAKKYFFHLKNSLNSGKSNLGISR